MDTVSWVLLLCLAVLFYVVCSLLLLRYPLILHKRKRLEFYCRHISHRGGSGERIENTMEAFTHAVSAGTDMLEMDCHLTLDGYVVVSHDNNLLRQTGDDKTVSSLKFQDLPLYEEKLEVTFMSVSNLVHKYGREHITVWASEEHEVMAKCLKQNPSMPYMFTMRRVIMLLLLFYTGLLPFVPLGESVLMFYLPRIINRTYIPEEAYMKNRFVVYLLQKLITWKSLFEHLIKRGLQVQLFVCNEETDMAAAFAMGATGVMTDYPTVLSDYIRNTLHLLQFTRDYKGHSEHCLTSR